MDTKKTLSIIVLISLIIGIANECIANITSIWIYNPWWMTFVNLILMFGLVMPMVAFFLRDNTLKTIYIGGTMVGLAYEFLDQYILNWAYFPDGKFLFINNVVISRIVIGFLWGLVPMVTLWVTRAILNWMANDEQIKPLKG